MKPIFKDTMGRWIISGLFKETSQFNTYVIWTLDEAKHLYLETNDPTGYIFATEHLGGWKHWLVLKNSPTMSPYIREWEEELEVKLRSIALVKILDHSKNEKGFQAARYLVESGWVPKTAGRPTKEKINKEARIQRKMYDEFKPNLKLDS